MAAARTARERLEFIIGLQDRLTGSLGRVQRSVRQFQERVNRGAAAIRSGFIVATAALLGFVGALQPAIAHARALRSVAALGVSTENLQILSRDALRFSNRFGESATEFVRSAYDIQSAIAGLTGRELARFTTAANVTAKATESSATEMTGFFGTMFGIFQREAEAIGRAEWVDRLAGRTALAVRMFKTTGSRMSQFFASLGAEGQAAGLRMGEQLALGGMLQATMGGGEAGTVARAFLQNVGRAQGALGLSFTDAQGRMLTVAGILERIRGQFGAIDTVAKSDLIKKAFGSDEAVKLVKLLIGQTADLRRNTEALEGVTGIAPALEAAGKNIDPIERLGRVLQNIAIVWGTALLPVIVPMADRLTAMGETLQGWLQRFPNIARAVGILSLAVLGLSLGIGALAVAIGVVTLVSLPLTGAILAVAAAWGAMWLFGGKVLAWFREMPLPVKFLLAVLFPFIGVPLLLLAHWRDFIEFIQGAWNNVLKPFFEFLTGTDLESNIGLSASADRITQAPEGRTVPGAAEAIRNAASSDNRRQYYIDQMTIESKERFDAGWLSRTLAFEGQG